MARASERPSERPSDRPPASRQIREGERVIQLDEAGTSPGSLVIDPSAAAPVLDLTVFDGDHLTEKHIESISEVKPYLDKGEGVVWLNIDGVGNAGLIAEIGKLFDLHRLTLEDVTQVHQRPKVEVFRGYVFVVVRMVFLEGALETEQLSLVIGDRYLLTFQEGRPGDCLEPVRTRLRKAIGRLRSAGPDYLAYALIDTVTDHYYPVVGEYGDRLDRLEDEIIQEKAYDDIVQRIHENKRELLLLRRTIFPQRDSIATLMRDPTPLISEETRVFFRDVADHTVQLVELLDSYRELAASLVDIHLSLASHRMNEVMRILTLVGAFFIPLTFVAGLYGMNFDPDSSALNMPELRHPYGYPLTILFMVMMTVGMVIYFRRKGWLGRPNKR
jgi:magnesium transporter